MLVTTLLNLSVNNMVERLRDIGLNIV
jgi:hypothetical protein